MCRATAMARKTALTLGMALLGFGCDKQRPSVLLVTIDTLRADAVGPLAGVTPELDRLARTGTTFTRATSVSPLTLPSHATLLTGVRPGRHGLTVNGVAVPQLPAATLAELLRQAGYATSAFVSSAMLDHRHGLDRGFDHYDDDLLLPGGPPKPHERRGDLTVDKAIEWLGHQAGPWFTWVHLYDPHSPYAAPGGRTEPPRSAYLDEVAYADAQLGRLLSAAEGASGELLVVVTSDHGEGLGEHGEQTHGLMLYESTMHVPLVFARSDQDAPGFPEAGVQRDDLVGLLDVLPTILDILGLPVESGLDGRSLLTPAPLRSLPLEARAGWFYYGFSPLVGVRFGDLKLLGAPDSDPAGWTLHDLGSDPDELSGRPGHDHALRAAVLSTAPDQEATAVADDAVLRALGYMGVTPPAASSSARRDPRDAMLLIEALDAANSLLVAGDGSGALASLAPYREEFADVAELQLFVGKANRALGRLADAREALEQAVGLQASSLGALHELAKVLMEQADKTRGAADQVPSLLDLAEALVPGDPETAALRALHDVVFGDPADALVRLAPVLAERPRAPNLLQVQIRALRALGREQAALAVEARLAER